MLQVKGVTRVDYFHFVCAKCDETLRVLLGSEGLVPKIVVECDSCGERGTMKLWQTLPQ
jgi:DNA-directed RNA polymerase subunit RPC12/RpoP